MTDPNCFANNPAVKVEEYYTCSICKSMFTKNSYLTHHMQVHEDEMQTKDDVFDRWASTTVDTKDFLTTSSTDNLDTGSGKEPNAVRNLSLKAHLTNTYTIKPDTNNDSNAIPDHVYNEHTVIKQEPNYTTETSCSQAGPHGYDSQIVTYTLPMKPHPCPDCGKSFSRRSDLNVHILRMHTRDKPYKCDVCQKSYARRIDLVKHKHMHTATCDIIGDANNTCNTCDTAYLSCNPAAEKEMHFPNTSAVQSVDNNNTIVDDATRTTKNKRHTCFHCKKPFARRGDLNIHILRMHTIDKPYKCDLCMKSFVRRIDLEKHKCSRTAGSGKVSDMNTLCPRRDTAHLNKEPIEDSKAQFKHLTEHPLTQNNIQPYDNSVCPATITNSHDATSDTHKGTEDQQFVCGHCNRGFTTLWGRRSHMAAHYRDHKTHRSRVIRVTSRSNRKVT